MLATEPERLGGHLHVTALLLCFPTAFSITFGVAMLLASHLSQQASAVTLLSTFASKLPQESLLGSEYTLRKCFFL